MVQRTERCKARAKAKLHTGALKASLSALLGSLWLLAPAAGRPDSSASENLVGREVLVRKTTPLYWQKQDVAFVVASKRLLPDDSQNAFRYRVKSIDGDWLELVAGDRGGHDRCVDVSDTVVHYGLSLFVKRFDLVPATAKELRRAYKDKTSIYLAAGVPLGRTRADGAREVSLGAYDFMLPLSADEIADNFDPASYSPSASFNDGQGKLLFPRGPLSLSFADGKRKIEARTQDLVLYRLKPRGLLGLAESCFVAVVKTPKSLMGAKLGEMGLVQMVQAPEESTYLVRAAAPVYTSDGTHVGTTPRTQDVAQKLFSEKNGRLCHDARLDDDDHTAPPFSLCVAAADVKR